MHYLNLNKGLTVVKGLIVDKEKDQIYFIFSYVFITLTSSF